MAKSLTSPLQPKRSETRQRPGVDYELRMAENGSRLMERVEKPPKRSFWVRWLMAYGEALSHHQYFM